MTNTMVNKRFQEVATAVMNDVRASGAKIDTMDEMYETACKYVQMPRDKFDELCTKIQNKDFASEVNAELSEDELDTVVGGGLFSYIADHAATIGIAIGVIAAAAVVMTGVGALGGLAMGALTSSYISEVTFGVMWGAAAADGAFMGGFLTAAGGLGVAGIVGYCCYKQDTMEASN